MKNYRRNNYIGKMKKGFKQKLSLLMIACLLFTGYRGLTISGRADSSHTEQNNEIEVSGTQVKVQLLGADLRRAATEAILKGEKVGKSNLRSYSKDQELATEFEEYFDGEKEIYNIPLNSIAENLEESLNAEEAGLQIYVERDAKDLDRLVRKESKESLLLYSKESAVAGLLPKKEEATTVSLTEEKASDSNLERNTELTGSELITFVYENKSTERMTFQLSVDGNKYPKVTVASKTSLFKQFLGDAKKAQAEAKNAKATEAKVESTEAQTVEASKVEESSAEAKQEVAESKATEASKATEESKASEETRKDDSEVAIVSTAAEKAVAETAEAKAEVKAEASEEATEATEAEVKETAAKAEKATEAQKAVVEDSSLLKDITEHSEEILPELQSIRFTQYSLNELGRKSQNVEIEGFGNVQVFYDEAAFDGDVVLEAKRLFKPEEEAEGEKLSEEQVKVLKEHSIYDDAASLDIRFVDKKDSAVEVEPKSPVSVRISIDKKALPAEVSSDAISIHHLVENNETKEIERVETVVQSAEISRLENMGFSNDEIIERIQEIAGDKSNKEEFSTLTKEEPSTQKQEETITKEFTVGSFSLYQITYTEMGWCLPIRFHYVDKNFNEIGPTVRINDDYYSGIEYTLDGMGNVVKATYDNPKHTYYRRDIAKNTPSNPMDAGEAMKYFEGYKFIEVYPYKKMFDDGDPKKNLDKSVQDHYLDHLDVNNANPGDFFDIRYKYSPGQKEFGEGVDFIDDTGFQTVKSKQDGLGVTRWIWYQNGKKILCSVRDFYFVYDTEPGNADKRNSREVESRNEKYITNNLDGTYDLTLTGQIKKQEKEKLDIVFLVDVTKSRNLPFDYIDTEYNFEETDYAKDGVPSRKAKIEENITSLVEKVSKNANLDAQYALVGFGGSKDMVSSISYMDGDKMQVTKNDITITDTPYNDLTYVSTFTASVDDFKQQLSSLKENPHKRTGANYSAAMIGLKYILTGSGSERIQGNVIETKNPARTDAKKIIIMVTDGDAALSYTPQKGVYDDTIKTKNTNNKYGAYSYFKEFEEGYSYGNALEFSRVALNQARGILSGINNYAAFYSVGVGNAKNWEHLKELTEKHGYDHSRDWSAIGYKDKYIQAKSVLAKGADSKVFDGSTPDRLEQSFKELEAIVAPSRISNITINDTLSENVDLVQNTKLKAEIFKLKDNGIEADGEALTEEEYKKLGLKKLVTNKTWNKEKNRQEISLETDPKNFELPAGYEIRLTAKIKPSEIAYKKLRKGLAETDQGMKRTDLNDIYRTYLNGRIYGDANKYGASTDIQGLFTNDEAKFNYSWRGQPQEKPYNKPIVKVQSRDFKIEKQIVGLDGNAYVTSDNKSKSKGDGTASGFTKLGIEILKDIKFTVYEIQDDGTPKEYVSFKLYQDGSNEDQSKEGIIKVGDITVKRHQVEYNKEYDRLSLGYTITGLDPSKKYKVKETVSGKSYQYTNVSENFANLKYEFKESANDSNEEAFNLTDGKVVTVKNTYEKENPKKKVVVQKEVKEMGLPAFTQAEQEREFDFYLALKDDDGRQLTEEQLTTIRNGFDEQLKSKISITTIQDIQKGSTKQISVFHFKLRHNTQIEIPLDVNTQYNVIEKKENDYNAAEILTKKGEDGEEVSCDVITRNGVQFTCTGYLTKPKEFTKFVNPKKLPIPTGVVRDITPYVFGIFGFVAMAGAYFAINKRRREA